MEVSLPSTINSNKAWHPRSMILSRLPRAIRVQHVPWILPSLVKGAKTSSTARWNVSYVTRRSTILSAAPSRTFNSGRAKSIIEPSCSPLPNSSHDSSGNLSTEIEDITRPTRKIYLSTFSVALKATLSAGMAMYCLFVSSSTPCTSMLSKAASPMKDPLTCAFSQ